MGPYKRAAIEKFLLNHWATPNQLGDTPNQLGEVGYR